MKKEYILPQIIVATMNLTENCLQDYVSKADIPDDPIDEDEGFDAKGHFGRWESFDYDEDE